MERALRIEEDNRAVGARFIGATVAKDAVARAHLRADNLLGVERLCPFGDCGEEPLVQVRAHPITERAQQRKAVAQDVSTCGQLVANGEQQLLLTRPAIEVICSRRLAHARVCKRAVAVKVPVAFGESHPLEVTGSVARIKNGARDMHIHAANVIDQCAEGWDGDHRGGVNLNPEHCPECVAQCNGGPLWEEILVALRDRPERIDLWLPDITVSEWDVDDVARDRDGAHPSAHAIPARNDHGVGIE